MSQRQLPRYQHVYDIIRNRIEQNEYAPGSRLPSENGFAQEFNVSLITVKRALELLSSDGLIRKVQGKGSFVNSPNESEEPRSPQSHIIGFIMDDFLMGFGSGIVDSIEDEAAHRGYKLVPLRSRGDQERESTAIDTLLSVGAEALIITPVHGEYYNQEILRLVLQKFPVVFLDRKLDGIPVSFVGSDNYHSAQQALDHLYGLDHRQVLIITPEKNAFSLSERHRGIRDYSIQHPDMNCTFCYVKDDCNIETSPNNVEYLEDMLQTRQYTAVFCMQYKLALMIRQILRRLHLDIPNDISVICFDENYDVPGHHFFTHIRQNEYELGVAALQSVFTQIDHPNATPKDEMLTTELIIGESTARACKPS
nr:GntR family transcriptional regulator [uncultured Agathobaculum sp.]